jgi:hypothetical protein
MTTRPAEVREPRTVYAAASLSVNFNMRTSAVVIPGLGLLIYALPEPHYHVPAKHDDPPSSRSVLIPLARFSRPPPPIECLAAWRLVLETPCPQPSASSMPRVSASSMPRV